MDNRTLVQKPTIFSEDDPHKRVIKESKVLESASTKLLSYYKKELQYPLRNDIVYDDLYVIHLNIERLLQLLDKPAKKLRSNQKRQFYGITPFGHTVLHVLAVIVSRNDEADPRLDNAFVRLLDWKHMDPSHVDHSGRNVFNHLIRHDSVYVRPEVQCMYDTLISRDIYPNPTDELREATLRQNYFPLWAIYYKKINFKKVSEYIIQNMNDDTYEKIDIVAQRTSYTDSTWDEINQFLITVNTLCPDQTPLFFNSFRRYVDERSCFGCSCKRLKTFHKHYAKTATPANFLRTIVACGSSSLDKQLLARSDEDTSIFEEATKHKNFPLVEHILTIFLDAGGLSHRRYEIFTSQIESVAPILVRSRKLDLIQKIVRLTSESMVMEHLRTILEELKPKIDATEGKGYTCATCWCDYSPEDEGFVFPKCGHYPFCSTCFSKMDFCPYCYEQSEEGKTSDMIKAITEQEEASYELETIKLWDMSHSFEDDVETSTPLATASTEKPVEASA